MLNTTCMTSKPDEEEEEEIVRVVSSAPWSIGTLLAFAGGTYYYTTYRVRGKDDIDVAIEKREEDKKRRSK